MNSSSGPEPHTVYEFGEFRLDAGRRLLYAKGGSTALAIKPKVLDALLYFVEHPGQLLEKDRLLTELWPGLVVEENSNTRLETKQQEKKSTYCCSPRRPAPARARSGADPFPVTGRVLDEVEEGARTLGLMASGVELSSA